MISKGFVANGAKVYIASRDAKACEKAAAELNALGRGTAYRIPFSSQLSYRVDRLTMSRHGRCPSRGPPIPQGLPSPRRRAQEARGQVARLGQQ